MVSKTLNHKAAENATCTNIYTHAYAPKSKYIHTHTFINMRALPAITSTLQLH